MGKLKKTNGCECSCHKFVEVLPGVYYPTGTHYTKGGKCYCEVDNDETTKH